MDSKNIFIKELSFMHISALINKQSLRIYVPWKLTWPKIWPGQVSLESQNCHSLHSYDVFIIFHRKGLTDESHERPGLFLVWRKLHTKKTIFKKLSAVDATDTLMCLSHLQTTFWFFFYISLRLEISCEWFTWNIKPHFLWKKKLDCHLLQFCLIL